MPGKKKDSKKKDSKKKASSQQGSGSSAPLLGAIDLEAGVVEQYTPPVKEVSSVEILDKVFLAALLKQTVIFLPLLADLLARGYTDDLCLSGAGACSGDMTSLCADDNKNDAVCTAFRASAERTQHAYDTFGRGFTLLAAVVQIRFFVDAMRVTYVDNGHLQVIKQAADVMGKLRTRMNQYLRKMESSQLATLYPGVKSSELMSLMASDIATKASDSDNQLRQIKRGVPLLAVVLVIGYFGDAFDFKTDKAGLYLLAFYLFMVGFSQSILKTSQVWKI